MSALEVLKSARGILSGPEKWTQGSYACDAFGRSAYMTAPEACAFCSLGAMSLAEFRLSHQMGFPEAARALERTTGMSLAKWNDAPDRTFEEVADAFDRTIARLEAGHEETR